MADAAGVLARVASAYAHLRTLSAQIVLTTESETEDSRHVSEVRNRGYFEAPDRIRVDTREMVSVLNGNELTVHFLRSNSYGRHSVTDPQRRPGVFNPGVPGTTNPVLLFDRIADRVATAKMVDEPGLSLEVTYDDSHVPAAFRSAVRSSPMLFQVDSETGLIKRAAWTATFQRPDYGDPIVQKLTLTYRDLHIDEPIPPGIFDYVVPPEAEQLPTGAGGRGFISFPGRHPRVSQVNSDESFDQVSTHFRGIAVSIQRRIRLSADGRELLIREEITTPAGTTHRESQIPLGAPPAEL